MHAKVLVRENRANFIFFSIVFFVVIILSGVSEAMPKMEENVKISFAVSESIVTLHEPIFIDFAISNGLTEETQFDLGKDRKGNFEFIITQPDKSKVSVGKLPIGGIGAIGRLLLKPKTTYTQRLLLNEWYQLSTPGKYIIKAKLTNRIETALGKTILPKTEEVIHLKVLPRNSEKLEKICDFLAKTTIESKSVAEAKQAVLTLSYIQDSIAVPYIEQVLKQSIWGKHEAIAGLGRIANEKAIKILTTIVKSNDDELKAVAQSALSKQDLKVID